MDGLGGLIFMMVALLGIMYFVMIRPQRKQMQEQERILNELQPGARVLLANGMFATLREAGDKQMVVELAPGVEVAILRQIVRRPAHEDEEEFEFVDGGVVGTAALNAADEQPLSAEVIESDSLQASDAQDVDARLVDPYYGTAELDFVDAQEVDDADDDGQVR